jgi:hypothetical protein
LHLSDLQVGGGGTLWQRPDYRAEIERDLRDLHGLTGPWDLVLVTGDLTLAGTEREFALAAEVLDSILDFLRSLGSDPLLLAVPGNHDLTRTGMHAAFQHKTAQRAAFWASDNDSIRQPIHRAFHTFSSWLQTCRKQQAGTRLEVRSGTFPGDFAATLEKDGARFGIAGLNTAIFLLSDSGFQEPDCDASQLRGAMGGDIARWAGQNVASILITHHAPNKLHYEGRRSLMQEIAPTGGAFLLHLCGSRRGAPDALDETTPLVVQAPRFKTSILQDGPVGYITGRLVARKDLCELVLTPRRLKPSDNPFLEPYPIVPDDAFPLGANGTLSPSPFRVPPRRRSLRRQYRLPPSPPSLLPPRFHAACASWPPYPPRTTWPRRSPFHQMVAQWLWVRKPASSSSSA